MGSYSAAPGCSPGTPSREPPGKSPERRETSPVARARIANDARQPFVEHALELRLLRLNEGFRDAAGHELRAPSRTKGFRYFESGIERLAKRNEKMFLHISLFFSVH